MFSFKSDQICMSPWITNSNSNPNPNQNPNTTFLPGNYKLFLEVLYAPESDEPQEGPAARSRRRAQAEAPMFKYPATSRYIMTHRWPC